MKRFLDQKLTDWKVSSRRKPLILRGARQVGKTYSLKQLGQVHFKSMVLVDLERNPNLHSVFEKNLEPVRICSDIEVLLGQRIVPGETLLFFDEIQTCPRAIMALRYFYEEMPDLHVVAAGSLLEFALQDISFPVGRVHFLQVYPLSFPEYLYAGGHEQAASLLLQPPHRVSDALHQFLCDQLRRFLFVGGLPASISAYMETGSMQAAIEVQRDICETYRLDFGKYAPRADKTCLNAVLDSIAQNVGQQVKYTRLSDGYTGPTLKKAFDLLCLANVVTKVPCAAPAGTPLGASTSNKVFKAIVSDCGIMNLLNHMPFDVELGKKSLLDIYRGALAEQYVGQETLHAQHGTLTYWSRAAKSSTAEVDYLVRVGQDTLPVEVKSGPSGKLRSLHLFLKTYDQCPQGLVLSDQPYAEMKEARVTFVPLYFAFSASGGQGHL